jgi:hypothetical protein
LTRKQNTDEVILQIPLSLWPPFLRNHDINFPEKY